MSKDTDTLGDRMKAYEALSTSRYLMPNCPVYARIDGRAFHTFCRGLQKPYSEVFIFAMQETCRYLVEETHACLGYVQSDEISLGWEDIIHAPFAGRLQKLESILASMASAKFNQVAMNSVIIKDDNLKERAKKYVPCFDCRVFNVPDMMELANCFLWRENDAIKNSISGMAEHFYSHKELQHKNSQEKVHMMRMKGYCFYEDTNPDFMRGTFFQRRTYLKPLSDIEASRIPEKQRANLGKFTDGGFFCTRHKVDRLHIPYRLTDIANKEEVLFKGVVAFTNKAKPTFVLAEHAPYDGNETIRY